MVEKRSLSRSLMLKAAHTLMLAQELERPGTTRAEEGDAYDLLCEVESCVRQACIQLLIERGEKDG